MSCEKIKLTKYESSKARERSSVDHVMKALGSPETFPWVEWIVETRPNGTCDARQKIDLIIYTIEGFASVTGLDTVCVQVKSSECEMNKLLGEIDKINKNGRNLGKAKLVNHNPLEWVNKSMLYVNGQWTSDAIAADVFYQICTLGGLWPNIELMRDFAGKNFGQKAQELMVSKYSIIMDYRSRFLDWVSVGTSILIPYTL
jgi:hypothetical protein